MREILSTALALGLAGLLHAAETAPSASPAAPSQPVSSAPSAPEAAAPAPAASSPAPAAAVPQNDTAKAKPPAPAKKLSKKAAAKADSAARADSLKAAASADSLKAAQAKAAADSAQAAQARAAAAADSIRADSAQRAEAAAKAADSAKAAAAADSAGAKSKKRKRVVRETTVNTINELKGRYRSPKKALFMSLIVPGLGQAYVGHHWFNYTRGAAYFLTDVALAYGWHYYVGVKQDRQIAKYRAFADSNWRQWKYEDSVELYRTKSKTLNPLRVSYCDAMQSNGDPKGAQLYAGCIDPEKSSAYPAFKNQYNDKDLSTDSVGSLRAKFPDAQRFYELIGKDNEFITGWLDAPSMKMSDSAWYAVDQNGNVVMEKGLPVLATSVAQQKYVAMRAQANDYARMQAWFLGGMVINHIVSAVDAALTARYHNKALYQTETSWYDRIHLDSRLAWDGFAPVPNVTASFTF